MTAPSNAHLEARLEQFFRKTIRTLGGHTIKLPPVEPGVPDRLVFMPGGRIYLVELKAETGALRPAQIEWHRRMALLDIPVAVLYGQQGVKDWVRTIFNSPEDLDPPRCCCKWGAAIGNRHGIPSNEWPEGPCRGCPTHGPDGGQDMDLCRRHKKYL